MNVQRAWDMGYRGQGVVVSILDDGIEKDHPDLKQNYVSSPRPQAKLRKFTPTSSKIANDHPDLK